ncbi:hypothetical protein CALVIDRAFT_305007 [Calocera viscosa TUFC12733]|uniref:Uncharacterized protein n=1 Tax=Calocera viscosa (strain TUFC12733) TaxID=1330018 RepID=A0A167IGA1_CALVF|nr:hypothetical protein CALVIDRAFT_305007 [Calocera viscosa TUFC12733]
MSLRSVTCDVFGCCMYACGRRGGAEWAGFMEGVLLEGKGEEGDGERGGWPGRGGMLRSRRVKLGREAKWKSFTENQNQGSNGRTDRRACLRTRTYAGRARLQSAPPSPGPQFKGAHRPRPRLHSINHHPLLSPVLSPSSPSSLPHSRRATHILTHHTN